jgi:hypothetical protein
VSDFIVNGIESDFINIRSYPSELDSYAGSNDAYTNLYAGSTTRAGQSFSPLLVSSADASYVPVANFGSYISLTPTIVKRAQSFVAGKTGSISRIRLKLAKSGSPTDNIVCSVFTHNSGGNYPDTLIADADNSFSGNALSTTQTVYEFNFGNGTVSLTEGTTYWIVISRSGATDATNYYLWQGDTVTVYGKCRVYNGSDWTTGTTSAKGMYFIEYQYFDESTFAGMLTSIQVPLLRSGTSSENVVVKVYAHSGTYGTSSVGTGAALAVSEPKVMSSITDGTSPLDYTFDFVGVNQIDLVADTRYVFMVEFSGGDASNYIAVAYDNTYPIHSGNYITFSGSTWTSYSAREIKSFTVKGAGEHVLIKTAGSVNSTYLNIQNSNAGGGATWTATASIDSNGNTGWIFNPTRYWVGGSGNWEDDINHWSGWSGGKASDNNVPTSANNVVIDSNSGLENGGDILMSSSDITCLDFTISTSAAIGIIDSSDGLYKMIVSGSAAFGLGSTIATDIEFASNDSGETIDANGVEIYGSISLTGSADFTLQSSLRTEGEFYIENGSFDANDFDVTASNFTIATYLMSTPVVSMGSGTCEATGTEKVWALEGETEDITLNSESSTIKISNSSDIYKFFIGDNRTYNNLIISGENSGEMIIFGSNTFSDFLLESPPRIIEFESNTTQTITTFNVSGNSGKMVELNTARGTSSIQLGPTYSEAGQSIPGENITLSSCDFILSKTGYPYGQLVAKIWECEFNYPDENSTLLGESVPVDVNILTQNKTRITFDFVGDDSVDLSDAKNYFISVEFLSLSYDISNYVDLWAYLEDTSIIVGQSASAYMTGSGWSTIDETDVILVLNEQYPQFTLSQSAGEVNSEYLDLSNSNVEGGATWNAGGNSIDRTNNTGWIFEGSPSESPSASASLSPSASFSPSSSESPSKSASLSPSSSESASASPSIAENVESDVEIESGSRSIMKKPPIEEINIGRAGDPLQLLTYNGKIFVYNPQGQTLIDAGLISARAIAAGAVTSEKVTFSSKKFATTLIWTAIDANTASWSSGEIKYADGTTSSVNAGNTGNIVDATFVYYNGTETLQKTTDPFVASANNVLTLAIVTPTLDTDGKCLITPFYSLGATIDADRVVTGRIQSTSGKTYFDLNNNDIVINDTFVDRVLIGKIGDTYGIKITLPGYDANTETNVDNYALWSLETDTVDNVLLKEKLRSTVSVGAGATVNIAHNLTYIPFALVFVEESAGKYTNSTQRILYYLTPRGQQRRLNTIYFMI